MMIGIRCIPFLVYKVVDAIWSISPAQSLRLKTYDAIPSCQKRRRIVKSMLVVGIVQPCCLFLLPTWAEKPALMAVTLRLLPHELQLTKYNRFSPRTSSVSGDLQVLQVTYSTIEWLVYVQARFRSNRVRLTNIPPEDVLNLLLQELALDD